MGKDGQRGFYLAVALILGAALVASSFGSRVTGQQFVNLPVREATEQQNKFSPYLEVAEGDSFRVPGGRSRSGLESVTFTSYDPINGILEFQTNAGGKSFTTQPISSSFFCKPGATADLIFIGETLQVLVNDKRHYPDRRHRMYIMTYANPQSIVPVRGTLAFSKENHCAQFGCEGFLPVVWALVRIDPLLGNIYLHDILNPSSQMVSGYNTATGDATLIVRG